MPAQLKLIIFQEGLLYIGLVAVIYGIAQDVIDQSIINAVEIQSVQPVVHGVSTYIG